MTSTPTAHTLALSQSVATSSIPPLLDGVPLCLDRAEGITIEHSSESFTRVTVTLLVDEIVEPPVSRVEAAVAEHLAMRSEVTHRRSKELARDLAEAGLLLSDEEAGY